ncbi:MAG: hypothetical protein PVJ04_11265 [Gemmatimonadota bacterium]|jgi:Fe-S-cluster-containing hydrogenase component 2
MSAPIEFRPVDPLSFDADLCISCNLGVDACPVPGAISLNSLARGRVHVRRKETGQDFFL